MASYVLHIFHLAETPPMILEYAVNSLDNSQYKVVGVASGQSGNVIIPSTHTDAEGSIYPVTIIDQKAFFGNNTIKRVEIPKSITDIGFAAFDSCENLRALHFHKGCAAELASGCFNKCNALETITLPETITKIGDSAFRECAGLKKAIINGGTGVRMFYECVNLEEVCIGDKVTDLAERVFQRCDSLHKIELGSGLQTIGSDAFRRCLSLSHITIPANVTNIDASAFLGCTGLLEITVDAENSAYKAIDGNLYTSDGTILKQYSIGKSDTHFTIPENVTKIGSYAFNSCTNITHIIIPKNVTTIGSNSFRDCENIQMIDFSSHETVPVLQNAYAFGGTPRNPFIVVPDALYDEWVAADVWSTIAGTGRIAKASDKLA